MVHFSHFFLLFLTALMSSVLFLFVPFFLLVQLLRSQFLSSCLWLLWVCLLFIVLCSPLLLLELYLYLSFIPRIFAHLLFLHCSLFPFLLLLSYLSHHNSPVEPFLFSLFLFNLSSFFLSFSVCLLLLFGVFVFPTILFVLSFYRSLSLPLFISILSFFSPISFSLSIYPFFFFGFLCIVCWQKVSSTCANSYWPNKYYLTLILFCLYSHFISLSSTLSFSLSLPSSIYPHFIFLYLYLHPSVCWFDSSSPISESKEQNKAINISGII